jgi:hypothetical protein
VSLSLKVFFAGADEEWYASHRWQDKSPEQQEYETGWAWDQWAAASCAERGGHWWHLDWSAEDGLDLQCLHCPAGINELYPDGGDVLFAELPLLFGKVLRIEYGDIPLGTEPPCRYWSGAVRAWVESEYHRGGLWGPEEWDAWVVVESL